MEVHAVKPEKDELEPSLKKAFCTNHSVLLNVMMETMLEDNVLTTTRVHPLHKASALGLTDTVKALLEFGADPDERNSLGETALHVAVRKNHSQVVEILAMVSDVNAKNIYGMTPLHWACLLGYSSIVEILVAYGADPWIHADALDDLTPRDLAVMMGYPHLLEIMENPLSL